LKYGINNPRPFAVGMGEAVARRTVLRKKNLDDSYQTKQDMLANKPFKWETWGAVAARVAAGSLGVIKKKRTGNEQIRLQEHIANGSILMSGRHLQHGDGEQSKRNIEVFSNCSTASTSFMKFYLLLNGSGVGRSYDDDLMVVDWSKQPFIHVVLNETHPDYDYTSMESLQQVQHKYGKYGITVFTVQDSREGWAKALEHLENLTFEGTHQNDIVVYDFTEVRPAGSLIGGMQLRPSAGPVPTMNAFNNIKSLKGCKVPKWWQTMYVDHYTADSVLVGGARRAARIAVKHWRDPDILDFINLKKSWTLPDVKDIEGNVIRKGRKVVPLWSANNSVGVDEHFWAEHTMEGTWAHKVFHAVCSASYYHGTGEPGLVNLHKLQTNKTNINMRRILGSERYELHHGHALSDRLAHIIGTKTYFMIPNPCQPGDVLMLTEFGPRRLRDIVVGDIVWTGENWSKMTHKWSSGEKPVYRYHLSNNTYVDMTEDHQVICDGQKLKVKDCYQIDRAMENPGNFGRSCVTEEYAVLAGLVFGDGSKQINGGTCAYQNIGMKDQEIESWILSQYPKSQVLISDKRLIKLDQDFKDLKLQYAPVWEREVGEFWKTTSSRDMSNFLRGLFSANGCVVNEARVQLKTTSQQLAHDVQEMLEWLGIRSYITINKPTLIEWENGEYVSKTSYDVNTNDTVNFMSKIGFIQTYKKVREKRVGTPKTHVDIIKVEYLKTTEVFDYTVEAQEHTVMQKGLLIGNCGEITLFLGGAYCVIGDVVPFHCDTLEEAEEAVRLTARALIRTNMLDSVYKDETKRTNRIGVALTGIHEFAWKFFKLGFRDMVDIQQGVTNRNFDFWMSLQRLSRAVADEVYQCSQEYGVTIPHTYLTVKPSGTTSKLFGLSEGAHLPSMKEFVRWVQFRSDDPLIKKYEELGYRTQKLKQYEGTTIVGFPTQPTICTLGMGDNLVTAPEATMQEQFQWVRMLEKYWLDGGEYNSSGGNQISYTLKYDKSVVSFKEYKSMMSKFMPTVRCCSVMPTSTDMDESEYEYLPEEAVSLKAYNDYVNNIKREIEEDIDKVHIDCAGGACPVDINKE